MNATISGIIDVMFKDTVMNTETAALHEELLHNCQDHYDDLIRQGLTETEAIDAVVESLKGMKEVIDEYPKKNGSGNATEAQKREEPTVSSEETAQSAESGKDRTYSPTDVRKIHTDLRGNDILIGTSDDGLIHVYCEMPEQIRCSMDGGCLRIRHNDRYEGESTGGYETPADEFSLKSIAGWIGKMINRAASQVHMTYHEVRIELPAAIPEYDINTMSGDITIRRIADSMHVHSTSGDIRVQAETDEKAEKISARTTSGDIEIQCNADQAELSSISGDLTLNGDSLRARMQCTSGDAEFNGCTQDIRAQSVSGSLSMRIGNADIREIHATSVSGGIGVELPGTVPGVTAAMKSVSGSVRCGFPDAGADASLRIQASSVSGSITIR